MLNELDNLADRHENRGARVFYNALNFQFSKSASFIENGGNISELVVPKTPLENAMVKFSINVQMDSAKWQYLDLRKNNPTKAGIGSGLLNRWLKQVQAWVMLNSGDHITKITNTTLDKIRSIHYRGIQEGLGAREIGRMIRKEGSSEFTIYRSTVIARTESTRSASQGHKLGATAWEKETGQKKWKEWSATNDSRTRDAHRAMLQLHIVQGEEKFLVGGVAMEAPGDPAGGAKNCVNCRCRIYYMSERMAKKLLGESVKPSTNKFIPEGIEKYEKQTKVTIDKNIFNQLDIPVPFTRLRSKGTAYNVQTKSINFQPSQREEKSKWEAEAVVYHEYGHAIDWQKGMRTDGLVTDLMDKYRNKYSSNKNKGFINLNTSVFDSVSKAFEKKDFDEIEKISSFADTLMALNPSFGAGHTKEYFSHPFKKEAEFIAHAFENKFIGNSYFKKVAPDLYEEMIAHIEKYLR